MLDRIRAAVAEADDVLEGVGEGQLLERRDANGENMTVLEAIFHAVEHFSMHTGQIILLTKMRTGKDLKLSE